MLKYILKRILQAIPVLLGVSVIVFLIMRVFSADPAPVVLGQHATPEAMQAWRDAQGLNDPIIVQYFDFLFGAIRGDLGESYYTHTPVLQELMARFPATVELALVAIVIAAVAGIALGVLSATHKNTAIDGIATILALVGVSMPIFWLGVLLIILFAGVLTCFPALAVSTRCCSPWAAPAFTCSIRCYPVTSRRLAMRWATLSCRRWRCPCTPWRSSPA